ncbi:MAG: O-antigen ligase family protein [Deltaproteobacteria bacterium]|nr:O-antigen ligase family protein [Deltaproteobacteria bacterium]
MFPPLQGEGQGGDGVKKVFPEQRLWNGLCLILVITVTALSLMALYQYITGHSSFEGRGHGTFVNPNSFAGYLLLTMPVLIGLYLVSERSKYIFFFPSLLSFAALLSTGTGGRWIILTAAIAAALIFFWIFAPAHRARLKVLILGLLAVLLLFSITSGNGNASFSPKPAELSGSTTDRLNIWKSTWGVIKEHPIRGVGFWSFHTIYSKYKNQAYKDIEHFFSHNDYLQLWAELGLIGISVFMILIYLYFRDGLRCLKYLPSPSPQPSPVKGEGVSYIMLLSTLIGSFLVLVHTISDFDLYIPAILFIFWGYISWTTVAATELGLYKIKTIDLTSYRIFTALGRKKLYIITAGIFAFLSFWVSDPYLAGLHNKRGKGFLVKGEYEKAVKYFSKAVDLDSIDDSYHFNLGLALAKFSNNNPLILKRAEHEMETAMKIAPYRSDIYFNLANFYREFYLKEKGNIAIEMMKKAKEFAPFDITITHNLAVLYLQLGMYKEAIGEFKKYLNEKPNDIEAHIEISGAYRMNKEYDNALKETDWLLSKNANNNYFHFLKANILQDMGQYNEAHNEYRLALREKGKEADVWYAIGLLSLKQNKPKEAEDAFRKAVDYR